MAMPGGRDEDLDPMTQPLLVGENYNPDTDDDPERDFDWDDDTPETEESDG